MNALVAMSKPDATQLDHGRVKRRFVGVDERRPVQEHTQDFGPLRKRQEQVVVFIGLVEPHIAAMCKFVGQF